MKTTLTLLSFILISLNLSAQSAIEFTEKIKQKNIEPTQFAVTLKTAEPSRVTVRYGLTLEMTETVSETDFFENHSILLPNLTPSTFYYVQTTVETANEITVSEPEIMATASAVEGEIRWFFNNGVDESFSNGNDEIAGTEYPQVLAAMYDLIDNAQLTIDVAVYNTSYFELVNRLEDAVERGVRVRYIHDEDTNNNALQGNIDFPLLAGSPDDGIMHNKFMIIDAEDDLNAHVLTGSMNWSFNNITEDHNNTVIIRDKTLALNYTIEFEEMWGGSGDMPDAGNAKFGDQKTDNTAHNFTIAGVDMECYFSPSDAINQNIEEVIDNADESLEIAMLLITKEDVTGKIKDRNFAGVNVRGIFDNDETDEFSFLQSQNVNVIYHFPLLSLHHKYAIADANFPDSDPTVLTGSHNWTWSAENINDENTLIIHDANTANFFLQEFEKRWEEVGGVSSTFDAAALRPAAVFPNPFTENFQVKLQAQESETVKAQIFDVTGRLVYSADNELVAGENSLNFATGELHAGLFLLTLTDERGVVILREEVVKAE